MAPVLLPVPRCRPVTDGHRLPKGCSSSNNFAIMIFLKFEILSTTFELIVLNFRLSLSFLTNRNHISPASGWVECVQ
jgi:hypothetical protein